MDIIKSRNNYVITLSRRSALVVLFVVIASISAGIVTAVAPILSDAVVLTYRNQEAIRHAVERQAQLKQQIDDLKKEFAL